MTVGADGIEDNPERCDGPASGVADEASDEDAQALSAMFVAAERGDTPATQELFATLYRELHRLARRQLHVGGGALTIGATTLMHEAYIQMSGRGGLTFPQRSRFFAYAARAMRSLIVDYARERRALKRGGAYHLTSGLTEEQVAVPAEDLQPLSDALDALARVDAELAELVELKFFGGFDFAEIAEMRHVSTRTVHRHWEKARLLLRHLLAD
ncbi:MAG TPA: ECF-type sigma factor [Caldimonas sp.]|nr:ECF-type sigma factor [Caldimonas sp.]